MLSSSFLRDMHGSVVIYWKPVPGKHPVMLPPAISYLAHCRGPSYKIYQISNLVGLFIPGIVFVGE
jgi:hypothetical protein